MDFMKCLFCNGEILGRFRKFCSHKCQRKFNSIKRYSRNKDKLEYKEDRERRFKKWIAIDKNRLRFNELLREPNRIRISNKRAFWRKEGLCLRCGKVRDCEKKSCAECRIKAKKWRENDG